MATLKPVAKARPLSSLMRLRTWHNYIGMLVAPTVLFFSLSGVFQVLNLHEDHAGYTAPNLLVQAASLHKDQVLETGHDDKPDGPPRPAPHYTLRQGLLKAYFIFAAASLIVSTLIGITLSLQNRLHRRSGLVLLGLGVLIPVLIVAL